MRSAGAMGICPETSVGAERRVFERMGAPEMGLMPGGGVDEATKEKPLCWERQPLSWGGGGDSGHYNLCRVPSPTFLPLRRSADKPRAQFNLSPRVRFLQALEEAEESLNLERENNCPQS